MPDQKTQQKFDEWWAGLDPKSQELTNKYIARRAFVAGIKTATDAGRRPYRFQKGRWRITVVAATVAEARKLAEAKLDERAERLGLAPRTFGWNLTLISGSKNASPSPQ